jgi:hypothetical protein
MQRWQLNVQRSAEGRRRRYKIMARFRIVRSALRQADEPGWTSVSCQSNKDPVNGGVFAVTLVRKVVMLHGIQNALQSRYPSHYSFMDSRADRLF